MKQAWSGKHCRVLYNGDHCFDGTWMAYCGKSNTWSGAPNAHTIGLLYVALLDWASYHLPSTNPFHHHDSSNNNGIGIQHTAASVLGRTVTKNDLIQVSKSMVTQVFVLLRLPLL